MKAGLSLVKGVGYNNGKYTTMVDGKTTKTYTCWVNMLKRCYSEKQYHSYIGCGNRSKPYIASCCNGEKILTHLGYYHTPEEAFYAYKEYKENLIKQLAQQYKDVIDERAYEALMKYEVDIDD